MKLPPLSGYKASRAIWDFSEATRENFREEDTHKLISAIKALNKKNPVSYRVAAYAPRDIDFGLCRVYGAYLEIEALPFEFSVFRDLETAIKWVNGATLN